MLFRGGISSASTSSTLGIAVDRLPVRLRGGLFDLFRLAGPLIAGPRVALGSSASVLELQPLMVEPVAELIPLGGQIPPVLVVRRHLDRHLLGHVEAERLQARDLLRVVRQQANRRQPEVGEDLVADPPLPLVGGEAEREVRVDRVEPLLLQLVRAGAC